MGFRGPKAHGDRHAKEQHVCATRENRAKRVPDTLSSLTTSLTMNAGWRRAKPGVAWSRNQQRPQSCALRQPLRSKGVRYPFPPATVSLQGCVQEVSQSHARLLQLELDRRLCVPLVCVRDRGWVLAAQVSVGDRLSESVPLHHPIREGPLGPVRFNQANVLLCDGDTPEESAEKLV